jgi:cytochrome c-type biogenesis protein CcmH/NrfG
MKRTLSVLILLAVSGITRLEGQCPADVQKQLAASIFDDARARMQSRLAADPDDDAALDCMGRVLLAQRKYADAVELLEKAIRLNENSAEHHEGLGKALMNQAINASVLRRPFLIRRMKTEFETAVNLDPSLVDARRGLVTFYAMAPRAMGGNKTRAREHAEAIMKLNPMRGHAAFGIIAEQNHDITGAEKEFLSAIALHPDSLGGYLVTAAFYGRQKRFAEAVLMYQKALSIDPANDDANKALASLNKERK